MSEKECKHKILNNTIKLNKHMETKQKTELLELFSSYVYMSNPDFKYNETYLKDMIPEFWSDVEKYMTKVAFRDSVFNKIEKIIIKDEHKCMLYIQIDETWVLEFDSTSEKNDQKWDKKISETANLNSVDKEKIYMKCQFNNCQGTLFSDYLVSTDKDKLIKFVFDSVESYIKKLGEG